MKILLAVSGSTALLGGLYATDVLSPGATYDKPYSQVYGELAAMPVNNALVRGLNGASGARVDVRPQQGVIDWHFMMGDAEVALFRARLSSDGPGRTRVVLDHFPVEKTASGPDRLAATALIRNFAKISMAEQVDATLEGRAFDQGEMMGAMGQHLADHPEELKEYGNAIGGMFNDVAEQMRATTAEIEPGPPDPHEAMRAATEPSVRLPSN